VNNLTVAQQLITGNLYITRKSLSQVTMKSTLLSTIASYKKMSGEIQSELCQRPENWPKFRHTFKSVLDKISLDMMQFERDNIEKDPGRVRQFKRIFAKRYRPYFLYGEYPVWSYEKPFGYPGDFKIIDNIYRDHVTTTGFDGLWDDYFQQMVAPRAARKRKEDIKTIIANCVKGFGKRKVRIMNLGSGPAREIKELLEKREELFLNVTFDCFDFEKEAISYAKDLLKGRSDVRFIQKDLVRLALKKNRGTEVDEKYDLIYSTGFFDYFDKKVATRMITNLRKMLKRDGFLAIANFGDKDNNSSAGLMEWAIDWHLVYRTKNECEEIFQEAGFAADTICIVPQDENEVILHCLGTPIAPKDDLNALLCSKCTY